MPDTAPRGAPFLRPASGAGQPVAPANSGGLGQIAKSFRDRPAEFPVYQKGFDTGYLDSLGPVATPRRVDEPAPSNVQTLPVRRSFVK